MHDAPAFLASWIAMMTAMMVPSAVPMIRVHRLGADARLARELRTVTFVVGYLGVWAAIGVVVWVAQLAADALVPDGAQAIAVAALLVLAGVYQFTPLRSRCLRACRTPMDFLLTHWHAGAMGAVRTGMEHGLYCVGCCAALMAVFVGVGAMDLAWAALVAVVVFVEKVLPLGVTFGRALGVALVAVGVAVLARPELTMLLPGGM